MQDIVVGNKTFTDVAKPSEIVQLLLNDEQLAGLDTSSTKALAGDDQVSGGNEAREPVRDLWNDEGDDFFRQAVVPIGGDVAEDENGLSISSKGKRAKKSTRGPRKSTGKKRSGTVTETASPGED